MKVLAIVLAFVLLINIGSWLTHPLFAQAGSGPIYLGVQTSLSGCSWPSAYATVTNGMAVCPINQNGTLSLALAVNGGTFSLISSGAPAGVTSWNNRSGTVLPAANDYSYSQLSSPPTTISCTTAQLSGGGSSGAFTASGCTIK